MGGSGQCLLQSKCTSRKSSTTARGSPVFSDFFRPNRRHGTPTKLATKYVARELATAVEEIQSLQEKIQSLTRLNPLRDVCWSPDNDGPPSLPLMREFLEHEETILSANFREDEDQIQESITPTCQSQLGGQKDLEMGITSCRPTIHLLQTPRDKSKGDWKCVALQSRYPMGYRKS